MSPHSDEHTDDEADQESSPDSSSDDPAAESESPSSSTESSTVGLLAIQDTARSAAKNLLEHDFEGIIEVSMADDGGWRTLVEVVERRAVPDTQDIIGRYEITLDDSGNVMGYELRERYQRGDVKEEL